MLLDSTDSSFDHPSSSKRKPFFIAAFVLLIGLIAAAIILILVLRSSNNDGLLNPTFAPIVVNTSYGPVSGGLSTGFAFFYGIPFAQAPVGDLRWKAPVPPKPWTDVRDATNFGPACPQAASTAVTLNFSYQSEDCLNLNIWTPSSFNSTSNLPVMVYIHGGGFFSDDISDSAYNGQVLAANNTIVVTLNYRLGVLGFLTLSQLAQEDPRNSTGNYGFEDMRFGLQWVRDNIKVFGGNPQKVFFFGESAGGNAILAHLASPLSKGLFQSAGSESGFYRGVYTYENAVAQSPYVLNATGCTNASNILTCLRAVPADLLMNITTSCLFLPVIDGVQLVDFPDQVLGTSNFSNVPFLIGANHDEGTLTVALGFGDNITAEEYPIYVAAFIPLFQIPPSAYQALLAQYPLSNYSSPYWALSAMFGDWNLKCSSRRFASKMSAAYPGLSVFLYEFNYPPRDNGFYTTDADLGAYHAAEIPFVWQTGYPFNSAELTFSNVVQKYWLNFAAHFDPNDANTTVKWPSYLTASDMNIVLNLTSSTDVAMGSLSNCKFWDQYADYVPAPGCTLS